MAISTLRGALILGYWLRPGVKCSMMRGAGAATIFNSQGGGRLADWHDMALDMYLKQGLGAHKISRELGLPFSTVNSFLYRWRKQNGGAPEEDASVDLSERLLLILKKRLGAEFEASDLCDRLGVSKRVLQAAIEDLREQDIQHG